MTHPDSFEGHVGRGGREPTILRLGRRMWCWDEQGLSETEEEVGQWDRIRHIRTTSVAQIWLDL